MGKEGENVKFNVILEIWFFGTFPYLDLPIRNALSQYDIRSECKMVYQKFQHFDLEELLFTKILNC